MKEVVVVSGKGGTGKTSFVASFALLARIKTKVAVGDCDVDAANLALLLRGHNIHEEPFFAGSRARVSSERCTGCGACEDVCRYDAIVVSEKVVSEKVVSETTASGEIARVDDLRCEGCRACSVVCPEEAISFKENRSGTLYQSDTLAGPMVHGALGVAQDNSGKLVTKVRQQTRIVAEERGIDLALFDGPPGIGCPVHAAIGGADLVVIVTEPSASGLHDLERMIMLGEHFKLSSVVVVNKYDLSMTMTEKIGTLALSHGTSVIGKVPFDAKVPGKLSAGETPLAVPGVRKHLEEIWSRVETILGIEDTTN